MNFYGNPACVMYTVLKIIEQEKAFIDPDTLEVLPIIKQHINYYASQCPGIEANYELLFRNNVHKRADFIQKEVVQNIIKKYHEKYIATTGAPPPIPEYIPATVEELSSLNKLLNKPRSRKLRRKNRKTRKHRN